MIRHSLPVRQLLQLIPRHSFEKEVAEGGKDRHCKGFTYWSHLLTMLVAQLSRANSLRQACAVMSAHESYLKMLGLGRLPSRTNLAKANETRDVQAFETLFWDTLHCLENSVPVNRRRKRFRFKRKLFSLDATILSLSAGLFPWARSGKTKCAVKAHVLLSHENNLPAKVLLTKGSVSDIRAAKIFDLPKDSIIAMDRGYNDYNFFRTLTEEGIYFVTRMKKKTKHKTTGSRTTPSGWYIAYDENIILEKELRVKNAGHNTHNLRKITAWIENKEEYYIFLTNDFDHSAVTLAEIYRDRWLVESFFKTLKQNLEIKHFLGTSENAVQIQIWVALLALTLMMYMKYLSQGNPNLAVTATLLQSILFTHANLLESIGISEEDWPAIEDG